MGSGFSASLFFCSTGCFAPRLPIWNHQQIDGSLERSAVGCLSAISLMNGHAIQAAPAPFHKPASLAPPQSGRLSAFREMYLWLAGGGSPGDVVLDKLDVSRRIGGMDIYVDESIHDRGNFIVLVALHATSDQIVEATDAMRHCGFSPGSDEFKSSLRMRGNDRAQELRERFRSIIGGCKIAIGICALDERHKLMALAGRLGTAFASRYPTLEGTIYLDQGIKDQPTDLPSGYSIQANCDSKQLVGIQLADCSAHFIATILLDELGLARKMVPKNRAYPGDDGELELAWELWASIRYALAGSEPVRLDNDGFPEPLMKPFGLVLSDGCDDLVKEAAKHRLGSVWVGCIH